ncbi:MAG TPA: pYEATS domain-containing protein [Thermoanaerobaculia bacterium]|nr:pYEATS domain-containing protein [Thermoanaerobaculia bacterium]
MNALPSALEKTESGRIVRDDENQSRQNERRAYYDRARHVMLVHKLFQSTEKGELYDILIYVVPSKDGTLSGVHSVEYFLGSYGWKNRIFVASDRSRGFPVLTAAYGPFLCTAEVFFTDGERVMLHRYIDFEMGNAVMNYPQPT